MTGERCSSPTDQSRDTACKDCIGTTYLSSLPYHKGHRAAQRELKVCLRGEQIHNISAKHKTPKKEELTKENEGQDCTDNPEEAKAAFFVNVF